MDPNRLVKVSKYLSKYLRHEPESLGLELQPGGWVPVDQLLAACAQRRFSITSAELEEVVAKNDKQRFSFDTDRTRIRANQGHSTEVDLQLTPQPPPDILYHGTGAMTVEIILCEGLNRRDRHHVHLSADWETARRVGSRHGAPVVFNVATLIMCEAGHVFYRSSNGVWLTDSVPPQYLSINAPEHG